MHNSLGEVPSIEWASVNAIMCYRGGSRVSNGTSRYKGTWEQRFFFVPELSRPVRNLIGQVFSITLGAFSPYNTL